MEDVFDKTFWITTRALKICRAHPYVARDKKWALQFLIIHGVFTLMFVDLIYSMVYHDLKSKDLDTICKNGVLMVVYSVITFQYCILLWHQSSIVNVIEDMNRDYEASRNFSPDQREVILKYMDLGVWVCKQWFVVSSCGQGLFLLKNIFLFIYYYVIGESQLVPFYELIFPPFIQDIKDNIFVYLATYLLTFHYGAYSCLMYAACVPLGPIFMLHACGQLELVKNQIDDLFVQQDNEVVSEKLKSIIMKLQYIYRFVDRIKKIFTLAYELTLKSTTIMLPITCYEIIEALKRGEVSLEFFTFIVGAILFSASPCYYSDLLMEKGEDVRLALYTCDWELHYDRRTRSTLLLMLQRSFKPIAINTIFRTLCLDALTDLFQQSYAIFNLMNAAWN